MDPKQEIEQLTRELEYHNRQYYVLDDPKIDDYTYDHMLRRLEDLEKEYPQYASPTSPTRRVGGEAISAFQKVQHVVPLESLQDVFSLDELREFDARVRAEEPEDEGPTDPFRLTKEETEVVRSLQERISTSVDKKTQVVSLSVTMQDPLIAATLTDTVMLNLQNHITQYRTDKARHDLEFTQRLFDEAQGKYYAAQQRYAQYVDQNQALSRRSFRTEEERLQNEMSLAYSLYNQTAQQLQLARAKVQESTPVYAVVQPATVPLKPSKPSKVLVLVGCVFLAGAAAAVWLLFGKEFVGALRKKEK